MMMMTTIRGSAMEQLLVHRVCLHHWVESVGGSPCPGNSIVYESTLRPSYVRGMLHREGVVGLRSFHSIVGGAL